MDKLPLNVLSERCTWINIGAPLSRQELLTQIGEDYMHALHLGRSMSPSVYLQYYVAAR
jgi:hypothetical protein